ncbi:MAG: ketol-acid reductoisomerase, partial [Bacteroidales bacterium]|nr:ketol-acid reductoisomerase [Bacteroidales bacterium]
WMYANCSATAQRGALDWLPKFRDASLPVFKELYQRVRSGEETKVVLEKTGHVDYKAHLSAELKELRESEMWQAGAQVRSLRPDKD